MDLSFKDQKKDERNLRFVGQREAQSQPHSLSPSLSLPLSLYGMAMAGEEGNAEMKEQELWDPEAVAIAVKDLWSEFESDHSGDLRSFLLAYKPKEDGLLSADFISNCISRLDSTSDDQKTVLERYLVCYMKRKKKRAKEKEKKKKQFAAASLAKWKEEKLKEKEEKEKLKEKEEEEKVKEKEEKEKLKKREELEKLVKARYKKTPKPKERKEYREESTIINLENRHRGIWLDGELISGHDDKAGIRKH